MTDPDCLSDDVRAVLADARRLYGISLVEVAVAARVGAPYVGHVLAGRRPPTSAVTSALIALLPHLPDDITDAMHQTTARRPSTTITALLYPDRATTGEPMTPDELEALDPATLTPAERGAVKAIATSASNPDTRSLAGSILANAKTQANPSEAYRRGADRAADYGTGPSVDHINR